MRLLRKYRFVCILSFLVIVLITVSFYLLWVHVPFTKHKNQVESVKQLLIANHTWKYDHYFNVFFGDDSYYILRVKEKGRPVYIAYNKKQKEVASYKGDSFNEEDIKNAFYNKFKVMSTYTEIGYDDEDIVYCLTYRGEDTLIYAFYRIDTGEFIKSYRI